MPKTRHEASETLQNCLTTLKVSREAFKNTDWGAASDDPVVGKTIKCLVTEFGLFDETNGFNRNRMVKQFGGEAFRTRVERCIDRFVIGVPTVNHSVQSVMNCLEEDNLKMYDNQTKQE